jgi:hypothetical protein
VECVVLILILGISIAAILSTMEWGSRSYAFAKEDLDRRVLLFNWFQAFESYYPGVTDDFMSACTQATEFVGGEWQVVSSDAPAIGEALFGGMRFRVEETSNLNGVLEMSVRVRAQGGKPELVFNKHFNVFSSETVSDDVI